MSQPTVITRLVSATLIEPHPPHTGLTEWRYDPAEPHAIAVDFDAVGVGVDNVWHFARDLLDDGLRGHAGIGDVRIWPEREHLMLALTSPYGRALLRFRHDQVRRFLLATYRAVPHGQEHVDLDDLVGQLLDGGAA